MGRSWHLFSLSSYVLLNMSRFPGPPPRSLMRYYLVHRWKHSNHVISTILSSTLEVSFSHRVDSLWPGNYSCNTHLPQGQVVQNRINKTQGYCEVGIQIWHLRKQYSFCQQLMIGLCVQMDATCNIEQRSVRVRGVSDCVVTTNFSFFL